MGGFLGGIGNLFGSVGKFLGPVSSIFGPVGQVLSAVSTAQSLFGGKDKAKAPRPSGPAQEAPFSPKRPDPFTRPSSLNDMADFSLNQQRSALATMGVNQGLGGDEDQYYRNLIQRSLIGEGGQVDTGNPNFLLPIESQYFSQQGMDTSDIMKFLRSLSM